MAFAEDFDEFLDDEDFADEVTITPADGGPSRAFLAIFDSSFVDAATGDMHLEANQPRLTCKQSDADALVRGDLATVKGKTYTVMQVQPDGTGMAMVLMAEQ